jgi:hypothetical protein
MPRLPNQCFPILVLLSLVGCGFSPGAPGEVSGTGGDTAVGASGTAGVTGSTGAGLTGGDVGTGTSGTAGQCATGAVPIMPLPPDILLVEDRSGSMDDDQNDAVCGNGGCGAMSKWALITAALNQVVSATDTTVNWGLKFFADANGECGVAAGVGPNGVGVAPKSGAAVATAITGSTKANGGVNNGSHTPTRAAEAAASAYLSTLTDPNPKYIVLATDGLPNCPDGCMGDACGITPNAAETMQVEIAITAAQTAGFRTFVVGIATASDPDANAALDGFAMAGGVPQAAEPYYYSVDNTASLVTALNKIVGMVASCTISLSTVPAADANTGNFKISVTDNTGKPIEITKDGTNGWSYVDTSMTNIILNGTACANIQNGTYKSFAFNYACAGQPICIDPHDPQCAK